MVHTTSFLQGQINAVYLIHVENAGTAPTAGTITVVDSMPSGITILSMSGPGWTCAANTCTRSDSFPAGQMLPTISVFASVANNAPPSVSNIVTVFGGGDTNIANNIANDVATIAANGWVLGWGYEVSPGNHIPAGLNDAVAVFPGPNHAIALRKNGTVVVWNYASVDTPAAVRALSGVVAVAAGNLTGYALRSDGTVYAWDLYTGTPVSNTVSNVVALAAADQICHALNADGTFSTIGPLFWASDWYPPAGTANVVQISARQRSFVGLTWDGKVVSWGASAPPTPAGLGPLARVEALGGYTAAGIRQDGTVVAWDNGSGEPGATVPSGLNNVVSLAGEAYAMALKADGTIQAWGVSGENQVEFAARVSQARALVGNGSYAMAILSAPPVNVTVQARAAGVDLASPLYGQPQLIFDGIQFGTSRTFQVAPGSSHDIAFLPPDPASSITTRFYFKNWSDGGAIARTVSAAADTTFTVNLGTQFRLDTSASAGGAISPATSFHEAGSSVLIKATPQAGYVFSYFSWPNTIETNNPTRMTMTAPISMTANFEKPAGPVARLSLEQVHKPVQGQQNAVYVARVSNVGVADLSGFNLYFQGITVVGTIGTGWTCSGKACSRTDSLPAGQSFPAILVVAAIDKTATGKFTATVNGFDEANLRAITASASSSISGAGNAVVGWGDNSSGQAGPPSGVSNLVDVSAGFKHSLALKGDGTVAAWGDNSKLQTSVPPGVSSIIAIAAGGNHNLALNGGGGVITWGDNTSGQTSVPAGLSNVIAIAAGANHSLALTSQGTVIAWGANGSGQASVPSSVIDAVSIAAGGDHSLAVLRNGTVVAWGSNAAGESTVPAGLNSVKSVSAGAEFSLALKDDGTLAAWGTSPASIQTGIPADLAAVRVLAAGASHVLAQQWDETLRAWGDNAHGQTVLPAGLTLVDAIAAGSAHSLAIASAPPLVDITFATQPQGAVYVVDGVSYSSPQKFQWPAGSSHSVAASSPQSAAPGTQYVLQSWSDGFAGTSRTLVVGAPQDFGLYFKTRYLLTTSATAGGSIIPSTGYLDASSPMAVIAVPDPGFVFSGFSLDLTGSANPQSLTMSKPATVTARFTAVSPQPPSVDLSPTTGSGASASLTATYLAPLGYQNLSWVQLLLAAAPDGGGQPYCFIHFDVQGDAFWVYGDGGFFVGPVARAATSAQLQNSLCALNTKTSTVTGNGVALTLKADVVFKSAAARNIYLRAYTQGDLDTGWVLKGTWTSAAIPLGSKSVLPASGSAAQPSFAASFTDPAGFEGTTAGWSQFRVAAATDGGGQPFCFVHYDRAGNGLWMYSSDVGFFLGPVSPGAASTLLDSSACAVKTSSTATAQQSGALQVIISLTLKAPMAGPKNLYQRSLDPLGRDSGWIKTGTWTIP
ncbi:hypothetical protein IRI77_07995 [Paludibaculum fermentans]|uniref:Bacterial repeat domain-containing protein n=2 Tax=Paludibaculum fermentans TaxID=1473598 RepID=A0A7S7NUC2_PALFE|nr:hypothetical protein IRI77_07995 [Paludibaculum fermentans]